MQLFDRVKSADQDIRPLVRETPLEFSHALSKMSAAQVSLKLENFQRTGSFKLRGATNKLLSLSEKEKAHGVVAASSGNHGMGVATAAATLGMKAVVFVPEGALASKVETIRSFGATVQMVGEDCVITEAHAREHAQENGMTYVSPYNDIMVVAGQGTIGSEIGRQIDSVDAVFVSLGGGGLISGVGSTLKALNPAVEIVACSPENSCVMHQSLDAGKVLDLPSLPTLSDGTAGGVELDSITYDYCARVIDSKVLVPEEEIKNALLFVMSEHHMMIEGAAAVAVAGFLQEKDRMKGKNVVILLCGANLSMDVLRELLQT